jgi:hypothetical protein
MNEKNDIEREFNCESACTESDKLVAYLYGEATATEAKSFERHLTICAVCHEEFAAFGGVRRAVGEWREATLRPAGSLVFETMKDSHQLQVMPSNFRSSIRALREFFVLSPLWLKTGGAFATLAVCALALFALANAEVRWNEQGFAFNTSFITRERTEVATSSQQHQNSISPDEIETMVNARVAERIRVIESERQLAAVNAGIQPTIAHGNQNSPPVNTRVETGRRRRRNTTIAPSPEERPQLVRRNTSSDVEPPRLYDLLGELQ